MIVYGDGGVGKSTFATTAPKPLIADCEGGSKFFGLRGIEADVVMVESWSDMKDFIDYAVKNKYETLVIDPIGELMSKLKRFMIAGNDRKLVQPDGTPSMAGWGWMKEKMRAYMKALRDSGLHVIFVAHVDPIKDEEKMLLWPLIETKLRDEMVNLVDIVGYMSVVRSDGGESKRIIYVDPDTGKFKAKDRTGQLGRIIEPDFDKIIKACQGTETYAWSKNPKPAKVEPAGNETAAAPEATEEGEKKAKALKSAQDKAAQAAAK